MVRIAAAALRADLENRARRETGLALRFDRIQEEIRRAHVLGHRLFAVDVLAGLDRTGGVAGMLEVGRGDDHGVDVLALFIKLDIARKRLDLVAGALFKLGDGLLVKALFPEIGDGHHLEAKLLGLPEKAWEKSVFEAVGEANAGNADFLVCAGGVERRGGS